MANTFCREVQQAESRLSMRLYAAGLQLSLTVFAMAAAVGCGGAPDHPRDTVAVGSPPTTQSPQLPAGTGAQVPTDSAGLVALGGEIFNGRAAGGVCFTCHGPNGVGTQLAPNLGDQTWIHGDGSLEFIANTIRTGVPNPKQHPAAMPPFAGMLDEQQIRAVATYVRSLSTGGD